MAEPIKEKKEEETNSMDISPAEESVNEGMEVSQNADQIIEEKEAETPEPQPEALPEPQPEALPEPQPEAQPMDLSFPTPPIKKKKSKKCPPGCMRIPKCSRRKTGGKRNKKSKKTKGGRKSRKSGRKSRKNKK